MSNSKNESQKHDVKQKLTKIVRKKLIQKKSKQKKKWNIIINLVPFENDNDRQKSYELWVESFFNRSN